MSDPTLPEFMPEQYQEIFCYGAIGTLNAEQIRELPSIGLAAVRSMAHAADEAMGRAQETYNSTHDALTGLYNRRGLMERGEEVLQLNEHTAVIFFDADRFKRVNDDLGHDVGDGLLKDIANTLTENVRSQDIVARLGGDEFVVVLDTSPRQDSELDLSPKERVTIVLERVQQSFDQKLAGTNVAGKGVGISGGFALYDRAIHHNLADLMQEADAELYANKAARRQKTIAKRIADVARSWLPKQGRS